MSSHHCRHIVVASARRFDDLSKKHISNLRALTKNIQDARLQRDQELIRRWLKQYDEALEKYIPVLMSQARTVACAVTLPLP